mgnify:FL=1
MRTSIHVDVIAANMQQIEMKTSIPSRFSRAYWHHWVFEELIQLRDTEYSVRLDAIF